MEPLSHGAIWFRHLGDLRKYIAFPIRLARASAPPLVEGLLHGGSFLGRQQLGHLAGAADRRLLGLLGTHVVSPQGWMIRTIIGFDKPVSTPAAASLLRPDPHNIAGVNSAAIPVLPHEGQVVVAR